MKQCVNLIITQHLKERNIGITMWIIIAVAALGSTCIDAFSLNPLCMHCMPSNSVLLMAKAQKKNTRKSRNSGSGVKGFGSVGVTKGLLVNLDRSSEARSFYDFMEEGNAGDNLSRCAIANLPLTDDTRIRGIVAIKPIKKGDVIIRIPYELAINLGQEGASILFKYFLSFVL